MKTYTREEKEETKKKLPKPILDFLGSQALMALYTGIQTKLKLNLRQLMLFSEIVNTTLMGLEDAHALETNLHQLLPELSNADTKELAADINDRIFKEAQRRLQLGIVEEKPPWNEEEFGLKEDLLSGPRISDTELDKLAEQQEKEGWKAPVDPNEGPEGDIPESPDDDEAENEAATAGGSEKGPLETSTEKAGLGQIPIVKTPPITPASTIAIQKLSAPASVKTEVSTVTPEPAGIQKITPQNTQNTALQEKTPPIAEQKTYHGGADPYREPVD